MAKSKQKKLGNILHVVNGEAITRPVKGFKGKHARVFLDDKTPIGKLGDPFGPVIQPFQPIRLYKEIDQQAVIGKSVYAILTKRRNRRGARGGKKSNRPSKDNYSKK